MNGLVIRRIAVLSIIALAIWAESCTRPKPKLQPDLALIFRPARERTGKTPIIIIPGMLGSRLVNKRTGKNVWPRAHPNEDDLKLPISPDLKKNRDDVVATEVVEKARLGFLIPEIKVYEDFIDTLANHAGYKRGNIDDPSLGGYQDTFYLFSYDWRRDNAETAQLLSEKIDRLKQKLQRPNLRFNLIAHSMGGLVARYYMMYGGRDALGHEDAKVNWGGTGNINKLILIGVPNEGTMEALRALVEGFPVADGNFILPLFGKIEADTIFSMPAAFQLLPHHGSQEFYDGKLQPVPANLYEFETWRRFQWSIYDPSYRQTLTKRMKKSFPLNWQRRLDEFIAERETYLKVVLTRARRFAEELDRKADLATLLRVFLFAGDCEQTLSSVLIVEEGERIRTFFHPRKMKLKQGNLTSSMVEEKMFEPGDGRITRRSALAVSLDEILNGSSKSNLSISIFGCEIHGDLPNNLTFQDNLLSLLLK